MPASPAEVFGRHVRIAFVNHNGSLADQPAQPIAKWIAYEGIRGRFCQCISDWMLYASNMQLDETDLRILDVLQRDGRVSNQELADEVGLSPSPCLRRRRILENDGVVGKYVALLNPAAVGRGLQAIVEVRLDHQTTASVERFEKEVLKYPQVLECYLVAGDWDYILRVVARDLEEFREFCVNSLAKIGGVGNVKSNISMKQVKYSTAIPLSDAGGRASARARLQPRSARRRN